MKTIYYNGNIITMDENNPQVSSILVEDGVIKNIGNVLSFKDNDTEMIDLEGKTILPGFIDGHSHFVGLANSLSQCDLSEAKNFNDIKTMMKDFMKQRNISENEWVFGCNYDHNFLEEKEHPTKALLNEISTTNPIVIVHASSHLGVANSVALETQNINNDIVDPEGGKYGRINGELTGYMEENAFINFQNKAPMISVEKLFQLMGEAQKIYASYGITTIQEGMVAKPLFQLLQYAANTNQLFLDVVGYIDLANNKELLIENPQLHNYQNHFRIGGYKVFLDGSPQGRTAWMSQPYEGDKTYCGYPTLSDEQLYQFIQSALENKQQLLAHCNGDGAAEQFISQFEKAAHSHQETYRPVMVHAQLVRKDQLERMKQLNMMPSFFVAHTYYWGDIHIENFGYERAKNISPANTALKLGIPFTFHQDSPVLQPDMLRTLWCANQRKTKNDILLNQEESISVMDGLKAITINGAYQYHEEATKGSICVGKVADFVILSQDPLTVNGDDLLNIKVLQTIKNGKVVYQAGN